MKASLKFRDDQKPLIRAKIPISILGLPFHSGVLAGDAKELRVDLFTAFDSGPQIGASYRPNDPSNPFTLSLKTGIGSLGSPFKAPMSMTAEFNLLGIGNPNSNPSFTVLFKPRFGDFSFKKVAGSAVVTSLPIKKVSDLDTVWVEMTQPPALTLNKVNACGLGTVSGMLSGTEINAKSVLPLSKVNTAVRFKWGVRVPAEFQNAGISFTKLPLLVMNKISIEHVAASDKSKKDEKVGDASKGIADVAEACMSVKRQLEAVQAENGSLRRAVEELKASIPVSGAVGPTRDADVSRGGRREGKSVEGSGRAGVRKEDVNEELKKALMGATAGGGSGN